jgi:delta14-sterol reductase
VIDVAGFFAPWGIYFFVLLLHLALPARKVTGYVKSSVSGELLTYRLNGLLVLVVVLGLWAFVCWRGWLAWDWLWVHRWASLAGACTLGLLITLALVLPAPSLGKPFVAELYLGRLDNPQALAGRVDAKMYLYLAGAVMLELNLVSFAAHHGMVFAHDPSPAVLLHLGLFSWFVCDYLVFEHVHLYTYDLFAERVGFKLVWGCLTFYPYFYAIGLWSSADAPNPHASPLLLVIAGLVFLGGWSLARGANMQKFFFKRDPSRRFLGIFTPETISDGRHVLLCSGLWGVSRHVNYLGELLMALGLVLSLGRPLDPLPWLYPLYYLVLLVPRERDDHRRCAAKYGPLWDEYCRRVPRRIVPGLY